MAGVQALSLDGGRVRVDRVSRTVLVQGEVAHLGGRAYDLLDALIEQRERVIGKDELMDLVWPGLVVEENNLHVQITTLRKVLGRQALVTVPGRGYRLALVVDGEAAPAAGTSDAAVGSNRGSATSSASPGRPPGHALHGRAADLARLHAESVAGQCLTVVGPAGVGKTALVRAWSAERAAAGSAPVWVDLMPLRDAALLPGRVAEACGVAIAGASPWHMLAAALQGRAPTLVLDNAEHLLEAVAQGARTLLEAAPGVALIVTSQAPLRIEREWVYRLEPLAVPPAAQTEAGSLSRPQAEALLQHSAVSYFVEQVRRADRRFQPDAAALLRVARLVRQLDGLPLALRLAAARVPLMGLAGVEQRLEQRLRLLAAGAGGARDADPRHASLGTALDWSHALLDAAEQAAFAALGVMQGEFSLELGAAVAAGAGGDEWAAVDTMAVLVDRSLLESLEGPEPRYRLLDSTRAYARERLRASGRLAEVSRHAAALLEGRFASVGEQDPVFLARLHTDAEDDAAALKQWRRAAERAAQSNHLVALEHHLREALAILRQPAFEEAGQAERLALLLQLGSVAGLTHGLASAECEAVAREALALALANADADANADAALEARFIALFSLFFTHTMRLDTAAADAQSQELTRLAEASGDERLLLQAEHAIYSSAIFRADIARTIATAESGYRRYRPVDSAYHCRHFAGHDPGLCSAGHAAMAHYFAGQIAEAERYAQIHRDLIATCQHPPSVIIGHSVEMWILWVTGRVREMRSAAARMLQVCRRLHVPVWEGYFTIIEGVAAATDPDAPDPGAPERMVAAHERVLAMGVRFRMPTYRTWMVEGLVALRRTELGMAQVELALAEIERQQEWLTHPQALALRAALHEQRGDLDGARADWTAAHRSAVGRGMGLYALRAATGLAALDAREGFHEAALQGLAQALRPFADDWGCAALSEARALLARLAPGGTPVSGVT